MKNRFTAIALAAIVLSTASVPTAFSAPETGAPMTQTGCAAARYDFPQAVNPAAPAGALSRDQRRTIAVLGRKAFQSGCSVAVVCTSLDDTKEAFEAVKVYCKTARDAIAAGLGDVSAGKAKITISAKRPKDGYAAGSLVLLLS